VDQAAVKAMILAAGEGTRLRPLTLERPKPMLPVGGKPLLEHLVAWLHRHDVTEIAINLHHKPEAVIGYFGDGHRFGVSITYSYEAQLLGTAGGVRRLQSFFRDGTFVVVYGDVFTNLDLSQLVQSHRRMGGICAHELSVPSPDYGLRDADCGAPLGQSDLESPPWATLSLYQVEDPSACGLVELNGCGRVSRFVEKPSPDQVFTDLASAGVLILEPGILEHIPPDVFYDFGRDLFPQLLQRDVPLYGCALSDSEFLIDIGTPASYRQAQEYCVSQPMSR